MPGRILALTIAAVNALTWAFLCLDQLTALRQISEMRSLVFGRDFIAAAIYTAGFVMAIALSIAIFFSRKSGIAVFSALLWLLAVFLLIVENASAAG